MIEPDVATHAFEASPKLSLSELLGDTDGLDTVVHLPNLRVDAIVVRRRDRDVDLLFDGGSRATLYDAAIAEPVRNPARQASMLRQALAYQRQQAVAAGSRADTFLRRNADTMAAIRRHMIGMYRDGGISRSRLDEFLEAFDLRPFESDTRVKFTIAGTYLVGSGDPDDVRHDGQDHLAVAFDRLSGVVPDSDIYTVTIDSVSRLE